MCDYSAKSSLNIGNCTYCGLPSSMILIHHSIPAIVPDVNCPHLYSNVECGHEKQGGHLVQTLSRGRLFSRLVIVQDTDTTQGWEVHGDIAGAPRRPRTPPILCKTRSSLMTKSPGLSLPPHHSWKSKTSMSPQSPIFRVSFAQSFWQLRQQWHKAFISFILRCYCNIFHRAFPKMFSFLSYCVVVCLCFPEKDCYPRHLR